MSVAPDMQKRIIETQGELQSVRARIATMEQSKKMLAVTQAHIDEEENLEELWQGVGKMFLSVSKAKFIEDVSQQKVAYDEQIAALAKKEQYYKTTLEKMLLAISPSK